MAHDALEELLERIQSTVSEGEDSNVAEKKKDCIDLLERIEKEEVDVERLLRLRAGLYLKPFLVHVDPEISGFAKRIRNRWKKIVEEGTRGTKRKVMDTTTKGTNVEISRTDVSKDVYQDIKDPNRETRIKARSLLQEALREKEGREEEATTSKVAEEIEKELTKEFGDNGKAYKAQLRTLLFNLRDKRNPDFRRNILSGSIPASRLPLMKAEEMASDRKKEEIQQIRAHALWECERGQVQQQTTDQFQCGKCRQRKCTYYQMQTRSADEPMTTFVSCVNCGNRWKFC